MSIQSIGSRLIKNIGYGDELKKIVTECVDGKTFTNIYDSNGKVLLSRVKNITKEVVGNKKVNTTTKVISDSSINKTTYDRVYNDESTLLGTRYKRESMDDDSGKFVKQVTAKQSTSEKLREFKLYDDNGIVKEKIAASVSGNNIESVNKTISGILYNKKGLPCPTEISTDNDMSLIQMRAIHLNNNPQEPYAHPSLKLEHLDNPIEGVTINNLDQYI